ncbi:TPA: SpaA isopeptide-forming pilin-related protein [Streptococcus suis]
MVKNKKWMNRHLIMLFILIFTQLFSSLLGVLSARANSPNTEVQHVKIFSRNQELTADDAHPIEMFQDDEEVFTLDRTGIDEQIMEMTLPQDLDFDVQKTLEHNQIRLNQGHFEGSLQVPADQLVQELLEPDGVTRKLRFHFHRFQQQIEFVLRPNVAGLYELSARWSDSKPMEIEQANMEEVSKTGSAKVLVKEKILEETIPSEDNQSQESDSTHSEGQSPTESSGESSPETSEDTTVQEESANPDETNSLTETSPESAENSETSTPSVQEEPSETSESSTSQEESASQTSEPSTSESSETSSADKSSEKHSESTKTESGSEESADSETQNKQENIEEKRNIELKQATETVEKSEDGKTSFRSAATVRNADIGNGQQISAYFKAVSPTVKSGESGLYQLTFKVSGAINGIVRNTRIEMLLPGDLEKYQLESSVDRMTIAGVSPRYDQQSKKLIWEFDELRTGQTYETQIQIKSENGIIPNNDLMKITTVIFVDNQPVFNSGEVAISVSSEKPSLSITKSFAGKMGDINQAANHGEEVWWKVRAAITLTQTGGQYLKPGSTISIVDNVNYNFIGNTNRFTYQAPSIEEQKASALANNGVIWSKEETIKMYAPNHNGDVNRFENSAKLSATSIFDDTVQKDSNVVLGYSGKSTTGGNVTSGNMPYAYNMGPLNGDGGLPTGNNALVNGKLNWEPFPTVANNPNTRLSFSMQVSPFPLLAKSYMKPIYEPMTMAVTINGRTTNRDFLVRWDPGTHPRRVASLTLGNQTFTFNNSTVQSRVYSNQHRGVYIDYGMNDTVVLNIAANVLGANSRAITNYSLVNNTVSDYFGGSRQHETMGTGGEYSTDWQLPGYGSYNPYLHDYKMVSLYRKVDPNLELDQIYVTLGGYYRDNDANGFSTGGRIANGTANNYPSITVSTRSQYGDKTINVDPSRYPIQNTSPSGTLYANPLGIILTREDLGLLPDEHVSVYVVKYGGGNEIIHSAFVAYVEDRYTINPNLKTETVVTNGNYIKEEISLVNMNGTNERFQNMWRTPGAVMNGGFYMGNSDPTVGAKLSEVGYRRARIAAPSSAPVVAKIEPEFLVHNGNVISSLGENRLRVKFSNLSSSSSSLASPLLGSVLLPPGVTVNTANPNWKSDSTSDAVQHIIDNFNGSGRQLIIYRWQGRNGQLDIGKTLSFEVNITISESAPSVLNVDAYGSSSTPLTAATGNDLISDSSDYNQNGNTTEKVVYGTNRYTFIANDTFILQKWVKGNRDQDFSKMGHSDLGSEIDYKIRVENVSERWINKMVMIDVLPSVGDKTVLANSNRDSKFTPTLAGPITLPQDWIGKVDVYYSTSKNPKRDDLINAAVYPEDSLKSTNPTGAEEPNWHTEDAVVDWANIHSFKIVLKDGMTIPAEQDIYFKMIAPQAVDDSNLLNPTPEQEREKAAWNSVAATANNLLPVEPERVGVVLYTWSTSIQITKLDLADQALAGVEFTLFKKTADGSLVEVSRLETDSVGWLRFTDLVIPTTDKDYYVLKETRSAAGYTSLEKDIEFSLNVNGQFELITSYQVNGLPVAELQADGLMEYAHLKIRNKNWTNLRIVKTNEDGSKRLNKAIFELTSIADNQVYRLETVSQNGEDGVAYLDNIALPTAGQVREFELRELTAPSGYLPISQTIRLTLDDRGQWTIQNQGNSDVSLDLFTTNFERTDSQSQVHPIGEQIAQLIIKNHPSFEIRIVKVDGADHNILLSDVQFKIAASKEDALAGRFIRKTAQSQLLLPGQSGYEDAEDLLVTTDETGRASFQGLNRNSSYWIVETKAKIGYRLLETPIEVQVPTDSEEQLEITVENHKIPELPHVGGIGILPNLFIGVCMIVASFVLAGRRKRIGYNVQK